MNQTFWNIDVIVQEIFYIFILREYKKVEIKVLVL